MSKLPRKRFRVTRDNSYLTVYPYKCPTTGKAKWRYAWREHETAPWRYVTKEKKAEIEESAWDKLGELSGGFAWSGLDPETRRFLQDVHRLAKPADYSGVIEFLESRRKSAEVMACALRFQEHQVAQAGEETRHLSNVRRDVMAVAAHFAGRAFVDILDADLMAWWRERVTLRDKEGKPVLDEAGVPVLLSEKTRNGVRSHMVTFWNWAVWDGIYPKQVTPADKLPRVKKVKSGDRKVWKPDQMIQGCRLVRAKWRPVMVLCGFFGMRPEEVAPLTGNRRSKRSKRGLRAEEIDWTFRVIRVPEEVSKVETPRNIPFPAHAEAWLEWAGLKPGMIGPVCDQNMTDGGETGRLGPLVFGEDGWPQDGLRHSYASNRIALTHDMPKVAIEMGTSVDRLHKNYHNPRTIEQGEEWFALHPSMIRFDPMDAGSGKDSEDLPHAAGL